MRGWLDRYQREAVEEPRTRAGTARGFQEPLQLFLELLVSERFAKHLVDSQFLGAGRGTRIGRQGQDRDFQPATTQLRKERRRCFGQVQEDPVGDEPAVHFGKSLDAVPREADLEVGFQEKLHTVQDVCVLVDDEQSFHGYGLRALHGAAQRVGSAGKPDSLRWNRMLPLPFECACSAQSRQQAGGGSYLGRRFGREACFSSFLKKATVRFQASSAATLR